MTCKARTSQTPLPRPMRSCSTARCRRWAPTTTSVNTESTPGLSVAPSDDDWYARGAGLTRTCGVQHPLRLSKQQQTMSARPISPGPSTCLPTMTRACSRHGQLRHRPIGRQRRRAQPCHRGRPGVRRPALVWESCSGSVGQLAILRGGRPTEHMRGSAKPFPFPRVRRIGRQPTREPYRFGVPGDVMDRGGPREQSGPQRSLGLDRHEQSPPAHDRSAGTGGGPAPGAIEPWERWHGDRDPGVRSVGPPTGWWVLAREAVGAEPSEPRRARRRPQ